MGNCTSGEQTEHQPGGTSSDSCIRDSDVDDGPDGCHVPSSSTDNVSQRKLRNQIHLIHDATFAAY